MTKGEPEAVGSEPGENVSGEGEGEEGEDGRRTETPADINIAMRCAMKGYLDRFVKCFDDEEDPYHETVAEMVNETDDSGKSPLDMAALLGRVGMVKELIVRGAEVNRATKKGYTSLHHAAAWGKVDCLKVLVDNEADLHMKTAHNETAREVAARYSQSECVDYLDWAEAKQALLRAIQTMRDTVADPDKVLGRLSRDDKKLSEGVCLEKQQWIESTSDATTQDFIAAKQEFEEATVPIWDKLNEPVPEKPEKK